MENSTLVRRIEPFFLVGIATFYVTDRLITEVSRLDDMATRAEKIPGATTSYWIDPSSYHYVLNNNLPLIAGVVFFLAALFVFHYKTYPLLNQDSKENQAWLFVGLTVTLLVSSAFCYYYFKQYVRFRHDSLENIIGLKAYSIYRKKAVLASTLGLGLLVFAYELLFQSYVYLIQKITSNLKDSVRVIGYLLVGGLYFLLLAYSFFTLFPYHSWLPPLNNNSFLLALLIIVYLLQSYCFTYILPELRNFQSPVVIIHVLVYVGIGVVSTIALFKVSNRFYFGDILAFLFISYVASFSVA
jgi:divalent metal cation (Fe/Co/Zn/Cd) transporter